jgi:catechol 2,3-dioxygenase-like lactoylglutathione lyase family enzyme
MARVGYSSKGILGIESVTYGVDDLEQSTKFFGDFGLERLDANQHGASFATPERTAIEVRRNDDPTLPEAMEPGSTVREIVWGVEDEAALDAIAADLERDRPVTRTNGTIHSVDATGYGIAFRVSEAQPVQLAPQTFNTIGEAVRLNARARFYDRARPQHIGHIVLYAPNFDEQLAFYTERLGFMVSDTLRRAGAFLRCSPDHHNLFLLRHRRTGLNHLSFGVHGVDEIMGGHKLMTEQGWEPAWGLGRHYIGSNIFYYFRNPAGGYVEYYADMDCITDPDRWQPEEFEPGAPEALFAWGGFPPSDFGR